MDTVRVNPLICEECRKEFTSVSNKNKHLRNIHKHDSPKVERMQNIMCSLCPNEYREKFLSYKDLDKHFTNIHNIRITESIINFRSHEEFEAWRAEENRNVEYACTRAVENKKGDRIVYYHCNRSNYRALKSRLGGPIEAEFFMSDDAPMYFNAWTKVMSSPQKPRRLLCTWHVIKNWNTQGRLKIKKVEVRQEMKKEMTKILKETEPTTFMELKDNYFRNLENEGENNFLQYLQNNYFQNENRVMMWAHCYRINAGINTNMAIESLNKVLKYNNMRGKRNIRVEKLLDLLDELVEEKMWNKIINVERPTANNYQHKITVEAHKKAEKMNGKIETYEFGKFKVPSCSVSNKFYIVNCKELCDSDCRAGFCNICKICIHRYECQCSENTVKKVLCKHIHAVSLLEERSESVLGSPHSDESDTLYLNEPTGTKLRYQDDVAHFIQESRPHNISISFEERRKIALEEHNSFLGSLDENAFNKFMAETWKLRANMGQGFGEHVSKKRKVEKQTYFPNDK